MVRWAPGRTLWFLVNGVPFLLLGPFVVSPRAVGLALVLGFGCFLLGHTVGLHRGILHGSFRMHRVTRVFLAGLFVQTGLGGPIWWIDAHQLRDHWQNQPQAPAYFRYQHGLLQDLWWNLHTTWDGPGPQRHPAAADPWLRALQRTWLLQVLLGYAVLGWLGLDLLVFAGFGRVFLGLLGHWYVGYQAHAHGDVRYDLQPACVSGTNRPWLGVLSLGEGFHNNHHAFPGSARIGHGWDEPDAGWLTICLLERLGLVWDVRDIDSPQAARLAA